MPVFTTEIQASLDALKSLRSAGERPRVGEIVEISWGGDTGTRTYGIAPYDIMAGFRSATLPEIKAKLLSDKSSPFLELPQTAAIGDDKVSLNFSDLDGEISSLCAKHGEGLKGRILAYYPQVELLLEDFIGTLKAPKDADGKTLKLELVSGFRSPNLLIPNRLPVASCPFIFGAHLSSQEEIDAHKGCPYNAHLTDDERGGAPLIGINDPVTSLPFTDCPRATVGDCSARLVTTKFFPGITTIAESIANNQTKGANQRATAIGNENTFSDPIRMVYGYRLLKALRLISYRPENDENHPEKGWVACLFEIGEGTMHALDGAAINGIYVGFEHLNLRYGQIGQSPSFFSPNAPSFSGTAHFFGRIQGDFRNASASSLSGSIWVNGFDDIRVYSDPETFTETYNTEPVWCVGDMLTRKRCAYGEDYARYDIQSMIDTAAWHAETVAFHDPNGNLFTGTRSSFNAELNARATQQQIYDACAAARMAVPFTWQGKKTFYGLKKETIDDSIPVFTDRGSDVNICADQGLPMVTCSYTSDDELINQYVVQYDEQDNAFTQTSLTFGDQLQQLRAGKAWGDTSKRVIPKTIPAFGITNPMEAARFGNLALYLGLLDNGGIANNLRLVITTWFTEAFGIRPYSLVKLKLLALDRLKAANPERFNFDYFRVIKKVRKGNLKVELTCQAYPVDFYERMEDVLQPPPIRVPSYQPNPGGGVLDRAIPVGFASAGFSNGRIHFALQA